MALLDLTTDLKSLRHGKDRIGGGSSKEPFVTDSVNSTPGDTGGPDFLLRANTLSRTGDDLSRIGQFMLTPKGLQFAAKQNLLSRTSVKIQTKGDISFNPINDGVYLPTSTLAQIAVNAEGGHLLKQGINPFRNTTAAGANTGIGFLDNILDADLPLDQALYVKQVPQYQSISENRLVELRDTKIAIGQSNAANNPVESFLDKITSSGVGGFFGGVLNNLIKPINGNNGLNISQNPNEILRYTGGPGSFAGVGETGIGRTIFSQDYKTPNSYVLNMSNIISRAGVNTTDERYGVYTSKGQTQSDFRKSLIGTQTSGGGPKDILSTSLNYNEPNQTITGRVNMGDPGRKGRNLINYNIGVQEGGKPSGPLDKINALPLYQGTQMNSDTAEINDLVKFRIGIMDNNKSYPSPPNEETNVSTPYKTYIHFRSFIDSFSDNYSANWSKQNFMGRGEAFHRYGGFERTISMAWTVAALSIDELIPMYQKLNYLASSLAPNYSKEGYMQGNIAYLTMGGYCYEQPGIITGLNISPIKESPYEIDIDSQTGVEDGGLKTKELAHYVSVTGFNFIPIHNFVPKLQSNTYFGEKVKGGGNYISKFGQERFIALKNAKNNNYASNNFVRPQPKEEKQEQQVNNSEQSQGVNNSNMESYMGIGGM